ncbi:MAG TPA: flagellin [Methanomicrobiales archaeon]|jgi:flagellar protein FlaG|nr:flagellin [Methanomicrobiales archaeon]
MSSETIVTAIFLITAVVAAGILTSQIFPAIYTMSSTVTVTSQKVDQQMRTDFIIIHTFASSDPALQHQARVWLKNTGTSRIFLSDLNMSTIFIGTPGAFVTMSGKDITAPPPADGKWSYDILDNTNPYWDEGETLDIIMNSAVIPATRSDVVSFQLVLYDGTKQSEQFTVS